MSLRIDRREFLTRASIGGLNALLLSSGLQSCRKNEMSTKGQIALQLYTLRNEIERDIKGTLKKIVEIGFENVETAFWPVSKGSRTIAARSWIGSLLLPLFDSLKGK